MCPCRARPIAKGAIWFAFQFPVRIGSYSRRAAEVAVPPRGEGHVRVARCIALYLRCQFWLKLPRLLSVERLAAALRPCLALLRSAAEEAGTAARPWVLRLVGSGRVGWPPLRAGFVAD